MRVESREKDGIAIVGMAGRFPGAPDIATFWRNLCGGVDSISTLDECDLDDAFDAETRGSKNYVRARGLLPDVDLFDASFFGMHAREAELTDPQHRVLLETCWQALEDAGYDPTTCSDSIGIYAGSSINTYLLRNVLRDRASIETFASDYQVGSFPTLVGAGQDFLATRIAYKLNLRGPAMTVQSACSTALLAVAQAVGTLRARQADVMLAGAVSISFPQRRGYLYQDGGMVSSDGRCRTFDASSSGTVFGAGAGVVVLKRLADARADGDSIYAVVRGVGMTNDGSAKVGYAAPSVDGQAAAVMAAHRDAGFEPATIDFIECHGTATPLGDPIEVAALGKAFAGVSAAGKRCAIGSVKPNVGHLDVAAGMAGLIKTALAIRHATVPATLHFESPNPRIDFASTPFYVNASLSDWPGDRSTRRAGVSAFGVGGTNVHCVLEAEPEAEARTTTSTQARIFALSARSDAALGAVASQLARHLTDYECVDLADVAHTLARGRRAFGRRHAFVAGSRTEAIENLRALSIAGPSHVRSAAAEAGVGFLFPGQGAQYVGMGRDLYDSNAIFRDAVDACSEIVRPMLEADLRTILYPRSDDAAAARALTATANAQPAIFTISYALGRVWESLGVVPVAMLGHSIGEFVAATFAGVFSLEDALRLVAERGRLMQELPPGAMLAVRMAEGDLSPLLGSDVGVAAVNAPMQTVVGGSEAAIAALEALLIGRDTACKRIATSHAFHSPAMDPIREQLERFVAQLRLSEPLMPYVSSVTGRWVEAADACSPAYWAAHARSPVRFADGVGAVVDAGVAVLLEVGPGTTLSASARQCVGRDAAVAIVASLPGASREAGGSGLLDATARLWESGVALDVTRAEAGRARRISLPTYPFERRRYWIDTTSDQSLPETSDVQQVAQSTSSPSVVADGTTVTGLEREIAALLEELSGETVDASHARLTFLELGFDSLFLGRFAQKFSARFGVDVTFRQLLGELPSLAALAEYVSAVAVPRTVVAPARNGGVAVAPPSAIVPARSDASAYETLVREQLAAMQRLMSEQLAALTSKAPVAAASPEPVRTAEPVGRGEPVTNDASQARFDAFRINAGAMRGELTPEQRAHVDDLIARVTAMTPGSKAYTKRYRSVLADPRVAAGFRSEWKEMVYPIVSDRASGSRLWDVDGNEYIDILNGFGQTAFGHGPDFVVEAVTDRMRRGFAIGPQTDLAGEVAELFCSMTGNERVTFCNTGSEAVMAALRIARTVTGRDRIVVFSGGYHGQFDEVLVKATRSPERSIPIAPGIPASAVANVTVLTYGAPESLTWIRAHATELAAVVVEPVQSRHPSLAPRDFLHALRDVTRDSGTALIFDEVVTGFRMHPAGMQAVFGVRADLATYGKVAGGGMPIGILAGTARFMDALDGGTWSYGDGSAPEVPPTFFAGTFVRHPLVMAAVLAVLRHLDAQGPALQEALTARTVRLVARLNDDLTRRGWARRIETYGSLFYFNFSADERLAGLLYYHLRLRGVYVQEGFPCFLTTAHSEADIDAIVRAFAESFDALQRVGIFAGSAPVTFEPVDANEGVALTEQQTEIWLAAQLGDDASCAFNESLTLRLTGELDVRAFRAALDGIVARHEALRTSYGRTGESMRVAEATGFDLSESDVSTAGAAAAEIALQEFVAEDARRPFDLENGPLVRGRLLRLGDGNHAFVFTAHHIVCDGWSMNVILSELAVSYTAARSLRPSALPTAPTFGAFARRAHARDPAELARVQKFWHEKFAKPVAVLDLPTDRPRPARKTFNGATRSMRIDGRRYAAVKRAGARHGCTLFATLLGSFGTLMGRLANSRDVVVGTPAAGQALLEDQALVGHCVDFLPIRCTWDGSASLADVVRSVGRTVLDAYDHQNYTLGTLVRTLAPVREKNRLPFTEIQFNLERLGDRLDFAGLEAEAFPNPKAFVNFDVFFNVIESSDGLRIDCDYNTDLFDAMTIGRWLQAYGALLDAFVEDPTALVEAVPYAPIAAAPERSESAGSPSEIPSDATVASLVEARAAERPAAVAAVCGDGRITYAELDRRANRLAHHLLDVAGGSGKLVGISVDRSIDMLVALLATHKAGCAYVPLDPRHPAARLRHILREARVAVLVADASADASLAPDGTPVVHVELDLGTISSCPATPPSVARSARDLAYVIYTSGSTGVPKGVEIEHGAVVNLLRSMTREPGLEATDVFLAVTTVSFDIAALELFGPLVAGGTVVIAANDEVADGTRLFARLQSSRATALQATPATWRMLLEAGFRCPPGFKMLCGGEALRDDLASRLLEGEGALWNMYGPTETTIWSSCARIRPGAAITVGRPIANTQFYVLDENDAIVPTGSVGQLHIAGAGVARGYVERPELTAEKFVANAFGAGRSYRTGDAARMVASGETEILGRIDEQVKLRGYRIELGEIEAVLAETGCLAASAVALREDVAGQPRLVAYVVERVGAAPAIAELEARLAERLPDYMIPSAWVRLAELPLNANGKLDRAALPAPELAADRTGEYIAPQTPIETVLAGIWAEVLHLDRVGTDDDVFDLGADSIHVFQITARANRHGLPLSAKLLFAHRTIREIARRIDATVLAPDASRGASKSTLTYLRRPVTREKAHSGT